MDRDRLHRAEIAQCVNAAIPAAAAHRAPPGLRMAGFDPPLLLGDGEFDSSLPLELANRPPERPPSLSIWIAALTTSLRDWLCRGFLMDSIVIGKDPIHLARRRYSSRNH